MLVYYKVYSTFELVFFTSFILSYLINILGRLPYKRKNQSPSKWSWIYFMNIPKGFRLLPEPGAGWIIMRKYRKSSKTHFLLGDNITSVNFMSKATNNFVQLLGVVAQHFCSTTILSQQESHIIFIREPFGLHHK